MSVLIHWDAFAIPSKKDIRGPAVCQMRVPGSAALPWKATRRALPSWIQADTGARCGASGLPVCGAGGPPSAFARLLGRALPSCGCGHRLSPPSPVMTSTAPPVPRRGRHPRAEVMRSQPLSETRSALPVNPWGCSEQLGSAWQPRCSRGPARSAGADSPRDPGSESGSAHSTGRPIKKRRR
jgi:hypothetical protein